jgi:hypothetical protein
VFNIGSKIYQLYLQSEMSTNIQHVLDCKMVELEDRTAAGFLCQFSHEHFSLVYNITSLAEDATGVQSQLENVPRLFPYRTICRKYA